MQVDQLRTFAVDALEKAGIEQAALEAELLLRHCLDLSRSDLFLRFHEPVSPQLEQRFRRLLRRRLAREPLQYITGSCEFWSLDFIVNPAVLIPRPETEFLLEQVLTCLSAEQDGNMVFLDLCTGSGCIATVLAREFRRAAVIAVDLSLEALQVARDNVSRHGAADRVALVCGDLMTCFGPGAGFDCIVTNPPYVLAGELASLQPEVRDWEPHLALSGGENGLGCIGRICTQAATRLRPGGWLFMEIGADIEAPVLETFRSCGRYEDIQVLPDLAGLPRVLQARLGRHGAAGLNPAACP